MPPRRPLSDNVLIVSLLTFLTAHIAFETLAVATLLTCAFLFVWDPLPPTTRLLAMLSVLIVAILAKFHNSINQEREHAIFSEAVDDKNVVDTRRRHKEE